MGFGNLSRRVFQLAMTLGVGIVVFDAQSGAELVLEPIREVIVGEQIIEPVGPLSIEERRAWVDSVYGLLRSEPIPPSTDPSLEVIYGDDNRHDYYEITDPDLLIAAESVCLVVGRSELTDNLDGTYTLTAFPWNTQQGATICDNEPFKGQLRAGFCTAFLVADDLLATAGHCVSTSSCGSSAFVFGFWKTAAATPAPTIIPASDVYFCSRIVDRSLGGNLDHCILQVDRPVTGRAPVPIRRTGAVTNGESLAVIGYGIALPLKEAGGAVVKDANGSSAFFKANLDTYGGNSGSPVFNLVTNTVEGILVRGAPDFVFDSEFGCIRSNTVPNTGNTGVGLTFEEISKTIAFEASVPATVFTAGTISLDRTIYRCDATILIEMSDADLAGQGTDSAVVTTSGGDAESVPLIETPPGSATFLGVIPISTGIPSIQSGTIEAASGETIIATYFDSDKGSGAPGSDADSAITDCTPPVISNVHIQTLLGVQASIAFDTDEPATGTIHYGTACANLTLDQAIAGGTQSHLIVLSGLTPLTEYFFAVEAVDSLGHLAAEDNGGACFTFTTPEQPDYFTEEFSSGDNDLANQTLYFIPDGSGDFYQACSKPATAFPTDPAGATSLGLLDDDSVEVQISNGESVSLYGVTYTSFWVGANGYLTFGGGDNDFNESLADHFGALPRISGLYDDLNPSGGTISTQQLADRVAVTFDGVPEINQAAGNSFQIEMFFNGTIALTHLDITANDGIVGLSEGLGLPTDFAESDLSAYAACPCDCAFHGDPEPDGVANILDAVIVTDVAFRGGTARVDIFCTHHPAGRTDVNCDGTTDVIDVVSLINVAFRAASASFCDPCACDPYPTNCP